MKNLLVEEWVHIPDNGKLFPPNNPLVIVTLTVKTRKVRVKGPKGEIVKNFRHMPVEMSI